MPTDQSRGSTSAIGVVLLVAVTIAAGAAVSAFALGLRDDVGTSAAASFALEQNGVVSSAESSATVTITYEAGTLEEARGHLEVLVNGEPVESAEGVKLRDASFSTFQRGDTAKIVQTSGDGLVGGDTIRIRFVKGESGMAFGSLRLRGTDVGTFAFDYTDCGDCASEGGSVIVTYHGDPVSWGSLDVVSQGEIDGSPGPTLRDGESFEILERNGEVRGTVQLYFTGPNGNRVLVAEYETP